MTESQATIKTKTSEDGKYQAEWFSDYMKKEILTVNDILTMYSLKDNKEKMFELKLNKYRAVDPQHKSVITSYNAFVLCSYFL